MQFRFYQGKGVRMIECRCPLCERSHSKMLFYNGHLPARIFCRYCHKLNFDRKDQRFVIDEEWEMKGF
jgi:hypothetical protein